MEPSSRDRPLRVRFAPSPARSLHVGAARTALFNWLVARAGGGAFVVRIEDTAGADPAGEAAILDDVRWLGIDWDEGPEVGGPYGPYYQSERLDRYQAAVKTLLEKGLAYYDYATVEEMKAEREAAERAKRPFLYSRRWMAETPADRARWESEGRKGVVRLKMPREGVCRFYDHIRGDMAVEWTHEADHVIQRADGSCLYNLANVVDDHDMRITHVIRAEEHLSNTPRQIFIAQGLGYELPEYAHVPFVAEPGSKNKLSKRKLAQYLKNPDFRQVYEHGKAIAAVLGLPASAETFNPVIVDFYRQVGYLPDALVNYLLLLGWSLDDKTEFFTRAEMIRHFSLERINKSAASFDAKKLRAFQERYMALEPVERKTELVLPFLQKAKLIPRPAPAEVVQRVMAIVRAAGERIKVAGDILDYDAFFVPTERLNYDDKAFTQHIRKPAANALLRKIRQRLETAAFEAKALELLIQEFAQTEGVKLNDINQPLRVAVTGKAIGFSTYETLALLGREHCLERIDRVLAQTEGL